MEHLWMNAATGGLLKVISRKSECTMSNNWSFIFKAELLNCLKNMCRNV